jgi:hypothetical protein
MAQTSYGRFVPTLKPDDLLLVEGGDPQTITSMRRLPANVLFLLDTGGELNLVKSTALTKLIAMMAITSLASEDSVSVIEYNDKIEVVSDWTADRESVFANIDSKLFSSKRSRFAEGLTAAAKMFAERPLENRHIVIVSDGVDTIADRPTVRKAMLDVLAANVNGPTLSVIRGPKNVRQENLPKDSAWEKAIRNRAFLRNNSNKCSKDCRRLVEAPKMRSCSGQICVR